MLKQKQFVRPPKKQKPKTSNPETAEEFQEAADFQEDAGGKHRAGDPVKSARAFLRALEIYDQGLQKHPKNFDLAYNKARLQLEISQQESLVEHIGHDLSEWLEVALESHQYALRLDEENPDLLFNTSQVLTSLAELLEDAGVTDKAISLWHKSLEMLSSCLSRQEMMFEQHRADFPDTEDGGVSLDGETTTAEAPAADVEMSDQQEFKSATVETPLSASDLLDTVHASIANLIALISVVSEEDLDNLQNMAQHLIQVKGPSYIDLMPIEEQEKSRVTTAGLRATFTAALADAQFQAGMLDMQAYADRLNIFQLPGKEQYVVILGSEAEARRELVRSIMDVEDEPLPATLCWKQLSLAQEVLSKAASLNDADAQARKAELYLSKGDVELLRHHLIIWRQRKVTEPLSDATKKSAPTLIQNAKKFYAGSAQFARRDGDEDAELLATGRSAIAQGIAACLYQDAWPDSVTRRMMAEQSEQAVNDYLVDEDLMASMLADKAPAGSSR